MNKSKTIAPSHAAGTIQIFQATSVDDLLLGHLMLVETEAWGTAGENIGASRDKIARRIASFPAGVTLARTNDSQPVGSQFAFRFDWNGSPEALTSWDDLTACGWTDTVHCPQGNTGFLVGVGVAPAFRQKEFVHALRWKKPMRASALLIAVTLDTLFRLGVKQVIGNARVPAYHKRPELSVDDYCSLRRDDGKLFDPVLRFHEAMGADITKPVAYSMDDPESRNAGCWVVYRRPFED